MLFTVTIDDCIIICETENSALCIPQGKPIFNMDKESLKLSLISLVLILKLCITLYTSISADITFDMADDRATPSTDILNVNTKTQLRTTFKSPVAESIYKGVFVSPSAWRIAMEKFVRAIKGVPIKYMQVYITAKSSNEPLFPIEDSIGLLKKHPITAHIAPNNMLSAMLTDANFFASS